MDPSVTSAAGARGLMQIMPAEGERLHAAAGLPGAFDADLLYVASYNAALGTTELGLKRRSLDGALQPDALPAVIASYNAGEEAVRRWLVPGHASDDFAEDIPYTETRRYVRTVLGYLMAWRQVYGDP
jgi:soluble lytic murein transglycosylase